MPDSVEHVQARHVRRCVITASGANLLDLVVAALNAQTAGRGDCVRAHIIGFTILTASGNYTLGNPDNSGTLSLVAAFVPYNCPATNGAADTYVAGGATLGVEVYYTGNPGSSHSGLP